MENERKNKADEIYAVNDEDFKKILKGAYLHFYSKIDAINAMNVFPVPDGDTGTNMSLTLKAAVEGIENSEEKGLDKTADLAAARALMGARGNSGVILSQFFKGLARGFAGRDKAGIPEIAKAFQYGVVLAYRSVNKPVEGTILTVAREMAKGAKKASRENLPLVRLLEIAVFSGREALERTKYQIPELEKAGVVDAGGYGMLVLMEGCLMALNGEVDCSYLSNKGTDLRFEENFGEDITLGFLYCTELIIKGVNLRKHRLKEDLQQYGDSLITADDDDFIKVHIHTNHPGEVLEQCLKRGSLHDIKIDNMLDQHREHLVLQDNDFGEGAKKEDILEKENEKVTLVSVCNGKGLEEIFKGFGCNKIINGGPTMNPRVQDFIDVISETGGDTIVLPNDKNIQLAAEQAAQLINKNVYVLPTASISQGINSVVAFDSSSTLENNKEKMLKRLHEAKFAEITYAVRDADVGGRYLEKNDYIGLVLDEVIASEKSLSQVLYEVINKISDEEDELVTLIYGEEIEKKEAEDVIAELEETFLGLEFELYDGGQPLYFYHILVE